MPDLVKCPIKDFTAVVKPELSGGDGEVKEIRISHFPCHSAPAPIPSPNKCHLLQIFWSKIKQPEGSYKRKKNVFVITQRKNWDRVYFFRILAGKTMKFNKKTSEES